MKKVVVIPVHKKHPSAAETAFLEQCCYFSFEVNPGFLFEQKAFKFPFGCHAWEKYEPEFWKQNVET